MGILELSDLGLSGDLDAWIKANPGAREAVAPLPPSGQTNHPPTVSQTHTGYSGQNPGESDLDFFARMRDSQAKEQARRKLVVTRKEYRNHRPLPTLNKPQKRGATIVYPGTSGRIPGIRYGDDGKAYLMPGGAPERSGTWSVPPVPQKGFGTPKSGYDNPAATPLLVMGPQPMQLMAANAYAAIGRRRRAPAQVLVGATGRPVTGVRRGAIYGGGGGDGGGSYVSMGGLNDYGTSGEGDRLARAKRLCAAEPGGPWCKVYARLRDTDHSEPEAPSTTSDADAARARDAEAQVQRESIARKLIQVGVNPKIAEAVRKGQDVRYASGLSAEAKALILRARSYTLPTGDGFTRGLNRPLLAGAALLAVAGTIFFLKR